jgi:hypothetical protein
MDFYIYGTSFSRYNFPLLTTILGQFFLGIHCLYWDGGKIAELKDAYFLVKHDYSCHVVLLLKERERERERKERRKEQRKGGRKGRREEWRNAEKGEERERDSKSQFKG